MNDTKGELIAPVLQNGRPELGMPKFDLTPAQLADVAAFLHTFRAAGRDTLRNPLPNILVGDAKAGEVYFNAKCRSCHSVTGDLAKIGAKYGQAAAMQSRFLWPSTPGPAKATVTTASGQTITGTIKTLTDFDVSMYDAAGEYHAWPRDQVKVQIEDKLAGHRALLAKYTDADIHNLTAYLLTLQ